jgi:hypothetical protein
LCIATNIDERRAASLLLAKHGVLSSTKIKQHTYTINRMKITPMRNQTRIIVVSPGVNDDDDGAAQKQQPTGERRRRVVHCSQNSKPAARGAVEAAAQFVEHPAHIGKEQWKGLCAGLLFFLDRRAGRRDLDAVAAGTAAFRRGAAQRGKRRSSLQGGCSAMEMWSGRAAARAPRSELTCREQMRLAGGRKPAGFPREVSAAAQ